MATDVYVMPMWRFFAGDFDTALETFLGNERVQTVEISDGKPRIRRRSNKVSIWRRWRARYTCRRLMRQAEQQLGRKLVWDDDGEVVYCNQFRSGETIQSYLWWLDREDLFPDHGGFPPREDDFARRFWWTERDRPMTYPHLQRCGYYSDFFLPVDFERPVLVDREINSCGIEVGRAVCSSQAAYRELEDVCKRLDLPEEYTEAWTPACPDPDDIVGVKMSLDHLRKILRLSITHALPVLFWG